MMLHGGIGSGMGAAGSVKTVAWRSGSGHSDVVQMHGAGHDDAWQVQCEERLDAQGN